MPTSCTTVLRLNVTVPLMEVRTMLEQRVENNNYWKGRDSGPLSREIARVILSNKGDEVVIYSTERGQLSFGVQRADEDEGDRIVGLR